MTQENLENLEKIGLNAEAINDAIEKVEMAIRVLTPEAQHEQLTAELYDDFFDDYVFDDYGSITNEIIEKLFASAKRVIEDNSSYHVLYVANEENSHLMYPEGGENPENDQFVDISEKDSDLINMPVGRLIETFAKAGMLALARNFAGGQGISTIGIVETPKPPQKRQRKYWDMI